MPTTSGLDVPLELDPPDPPPHAAVTASAAVAIASETLCDATLTTAPFSSGRRPAGSDGRLQHYLQSVASA